MNNYSATMVTTAPSPYHRKNRRRERPGARKRHALAHKEGLTQELNEGISMAHDCTLSLPFESRASPLRPNYERSWRAWKAREAGQRAADKERAERVESEEKEQYRLFGGEVDDDVSLCRNMLDVVYSLWGDIDYTDP